MFTIYHLILILNDTIIDNNDIILYIYKFCREKSINDYDYIKDISCKNNSYTNLDINKYGNGFWIYRIFIISLTEKILAV